MSGPKTPLVCSTQPHNISHCELLFKTALNIHKCPYAVPVASCPRL